MIEGTFGTGLAKQRKRFLTFDIKMNKCMRAGELISFLQDECCTRLLMSI